MRFRSGAGFLAAAVSALWFVAAVAPVGAEMAPAPVTATATLADTMKMGEVIEVLRSEGLQYGATLEEELFPGNGGSEWTGTVSLIYDTDTMNQRFARRFEAEMASAPDAVAAAQAFFSDARGQRILTLEIEARRALLDEAVEEAAKLKAEELAAKGDPRVALLRRFAEVNDLVEANVQGALNSNLAFYQGLAEGSKLGSDLTEEQMLTDVWGQEADVRSETENWLFPYLTLAYGPLSDDDLQAYVDFSASPEGQRLNAALFAGFDAVFTSISRDLGRAAGRQMAGQDI